MRNPRNKRRPRATPDGSHATGITPVSVLQRETAGFNNHDSLATINSVTRLYGVHLHYSSYLRSFYTLHDLLPPHAVKLLDSRTEIRENPGISPGGFIFIYARLVAYRWFCLKKKKNTLCTRCFHSLRVVLDTKCSTAPALSCTRIPMRHTSLCDCRTLLLHRLPYINFTINLRKSCSIFFPQKFSFPIETLHVIFPAFCTIKTV